MAIIDMLKGNKNIVRAYRGSTMIFERGTPYIEWVYTTSSSQTVTLTDKFIHVNDKELHSNYRYEIELQAPGVQNTNLDCIIGGSWGGKPYWLGGYEYFYGLYLGYYAEPSSQGTKTFFLTYRGKINQAFAASQSWTTTNKMVLSLQASTPPTEYPDEDDPTLCTVGGFHLLSSRAYDPANTNEIQYQKTDCFYKDAGKVYRISIYDENDNLIMNFVPKIVDGHKGMLDTVDGHFYAATDDNVFNIGMDT